MVRLLIGLLVVSFAVVKVSGGGLAEFRTSLGSVYVELLKHEKPVTVGNFIRYVEGGRYEDMFFHRWAPGFVVQGGGFFTQDRGTENATIASVPTFGSIVNEFDVGRTVSNEFGTIAMAKVGGDPDSATSQWFFNLGDNSENLDGQNGGFTVFGEVVKGAEVLERFNSVVPENGIFIADLGSPLNELPVLDKEPTFEDLVYVEIQLLTIEIAKRADGREISWKSVAGEVNRVEFRSDMQEWQTLSSDLGTGELMTVIDDSTGDGHRWYRVVVEF